MALYGSAPGALWGAARAPRGPHSGSTPTARVGGQGGRAAADGGGELRPEHGLVATTCGSGRRRGGGGRRTVARATRCARLPPRGRGQGQPATRGPYAHAVGSR